MLKKTKKIVLMGGPGTGKSSVIDDLTKRGYTCKKEISREIIVKAQKEGTEQLFLTNPILFSQLLLKGRIKQFKKSTKTAKDFIFFDRGIPDISAYLDFANKEYPEEFQKSNKQYKYDYIFLFKPWKDIYVKDNERYESFDEAIKINEFLVKTYSSLGYKIIVVPFDSISKRTNFILNSLNCE